MIKYIILNFINLCAQVFSFVILYVNWTFAYHHKNDPTATAPWSNQAELAARIGFYVTMIIYAFLSYKIFKLIRQKYEWTQKMPVFLFSFLAFTIALFIMSLFTVSSVMIITNL